jgi:hypothetical protein
MNRLIRRPTALLLPASLAVAALALPSTATAGTLPPLKWRSNPVVPASQVSGGKLRPSTSIVGAKGKNPSGQETVNPACLSGGKIYTGSVKKVKGKWRVTCPNFGKAAINADKYTTDAYSNIVQRPGLSVTTVTYRYGASGRRVLCYAELSGQMVPGWMELPEAGKAPQACNLEVFGSSVPITKNFGVFKYKNAGQMPSAGAGWWDMDTDRVVDSDIPIYAFGLPETDDKVICRSRAHNQTSLPGTLERIGSRYVCRVRTGGGTDDRDSFSLLVAPDSKKQPLFRGDQFQNGLKISQNHSVETYLCRQESTGLLGIAQYYNQGFPPCKVGTTAASKTEAAEKNYDILIRKK